MSDKKLSQLHDLLIDELTTRIQSGDAKSADLNIARQLLKDNNIEALPTTNSKLKSLIEELPFDDDQEKEISYGGTN
jgi:hypothetical protein|tara:strand:+ start:193 stop:423 length:231 start_codon:yes stop_codon:yes gene_type:complete